MKTSRAAGVQKEEVGVVREEQAGSQLQDLGEGAGEEVEAGAGLVQVVLLGHFALAKEKKQMGF